MPKRILVTGATGNVGSHMIDLLRRSDRNEIIAAVTSLEKGENLNQQGIDTIILNFNNKESLQSSMEGIEALILITPLVESMLDWVSWGLEAAKAAGVSFVLRLSSMGADFDGDFKLGRIHGEAERFVRNSEIPYCILRPNSFMQNYVNYYSEMIKGERALYLPQGDGRISLIDVQDVAKVAASILENPQNHLNEIFDLTGPQALSNAEIADQIGNAIGQQVTYVAIDDHTAREGMKQMGFSAWETEMLMSLNQHIRSGHCAKTTDALSDLCGQSPTTFTQFAEKHADTWR